MEEDIPKDPGIAAVRKKWRRNDMVKAVLGKANPVTRRGLPWERFKLRYLLVCAVAVLTIGGFLHLFEYGFFNTTAGSNINSGWQLGTTSSSSSKQAIASLLEKVDSLQVRVGKAMEEIQGKLTEEAARTFEDAVHQLGSERKKSSNLLVDIAVSLDLVHSYLQQQARVTSSTGHIIPSLSQAVFTPTSHANATCKSVGNVETVTGMARHQSSARTRAMVEDEEEGEWPEVEGNITDPLLDFFEIEEIRKYIKPKHNRLGRKNFMGANATYGSIGHACVSNKYDLEQYMEYDVGEYCDDDWMLGQKLMAHGCDPLPRRRCFVRGPKFYQNPLPMNESLWAIPDDRNVRWDKYICKGFKCLGGRDRKGFFKCSECFDLEGHEKPKWMEVTNTSTEADFLLEDVLGFKPGGIRIGLDFSVGVGTFAARMREHNVTIASATLNLGAPFNEFIALRGLLPLYLTVNQRLPFFDNTLDIVHSTLFLDGWIDHQLLDFVLLDWDRVIRPGGLLWIDRFFCIKEDLDDYLYFFEQLSYKRLKWVVTPKEDKDGSEMWFSAILEKPPRPF